MKTLTGWGLIPRTYLLTTRGRKTGRVYPTEVTPVRQDGKLWLVAPYGPVSWVRNARAAGRVGLGRRGASRDYLIREVPAAEAGPVLKSYVQVASATRSYFEADRKSPVLEFTAEAHHHPVFELTEADRS